MSKLNVLTTIARRHEMDLLLEYSHLSNKRGGWYERGGGTKFDKSLNPEVGMNVKGGILWKKLMPNSNERGVEGGKNLRNQ